MNKQEIREKIKAILIEEYKVPKEDFKWDEKIEVLCEDFNLLGVFLDFEKILNQQFSQTIPLVENIDTSFHSPNDIVLLIEKLLKN